MSQEEQDLEEYTKDRFPQEYAMWGEKFKEDVKDTLGFQIYHAGCQLQRFMKSLWKEILRGRDN